MSRRLALLDDLPDLFRELLSEVGELSAARGETAWLVGGTVRDLLLGRPNEDIDIVVEGDAMALAQAIARERAGQLTRHHAFGTARVDLPGGERIDFATARSESYPRAGDLPQVVPGSLEEDLARRDFSINAIAYGLTLPTRGQLVDPFDGVGDLDRELVRTLHEGSFRDDPTRALRAIRFALRFGYEIESRTEQALRDAAVGGYLEWLTGDRLRRELAKLLEEAPVEGPITLEHHGLLEGLAPGLAADRPALEELDPATPADDVDAPRWPLVLAALALPLDSQRRWELARRLRLSREDREPLIQAGGPAWQRLLAALDAGETAELEAVEAVDAIDPGALRVGLAILADPVQRERVRSLAARAARSHPALDGNALLELGCPAGPAVGEMLRRLRRARLEGRVADVSDERRLVERWVANERN